jgi:ribosomal protein S12 methylthiotransferase accessory factor
MTTPITTAAGRAAPLLGPGVGPAWVEALAPLTASSPGGVVVHRGWDLARERAAWRHAADAGHELVSVRLHPGEIQVGPRWAPGAGCAGCAEVRGRAVVDHPLVEELGTACHAPARTLPLVPEVVAAALGHLAVAPLAVGELYAVSTRGVHRHRVARSVHCPVCSAVPAEPDARWRPAPLVLRSRPVSADDPTRAAEGTPVLDRTVLHRDLVDNRFGPVRAILREARAPFAMSMAVLPGAPAMGHGRAPTFPETEPVAVLEAYERLGGFPFGAPVLTDRPYAAVAGHAVDPHRLGRYTAEQLAHPTCRVEPFDDDTPMDWVWGHDLGTGEPLLVPADIGFYQYEYRYRRSRRAARRAGATGQRHYFHESSSGCAVGSSLEEAALHALFEVAERDAFLLAWHRRLPLPSIDPASVADPTSHAMIELIESRGYTVHLLAATQDVAVPVVWTIAVHRTGGFPATFSSAGSGADPVSAVRGALREVAQLVTMPLDWTADDVAPMLADPWLVQELEHHVQVYTHPDALPRAAAALGGPATTLADAFPGWPGLLREAACGDVRGALQHVRGLFAAAGMAQAVVVDQSTRDHTDAGIAVVKAVVPDSLAMCFGHAQQRLAGLPRLAAALVGTPSEHGTVPHDPHPFP